MLFFLITCISSCKKAPTWEESTSKLLSFNPKDKEFSKALQEVSNQLYAKQWPGQYNFTKPKIRNEKMIVEWEHKIRQKTIRRESKLRCTTNIERLGLSCLIVELGPVNLNKLMVSTNFKLFLDELKVYLGKPEFSEELLQATIEIKNKILKENKVSFEKAKENEQSYKCGILITTGFYLGFPFYKRITLDSHIESREEYLRTYLHECSHQLFDYDRKFSKTIKLGFSWIGWIKSTHSWWVVEEKSCNLIADEIMESFKAEMQKDKRYQEPLATSNWTYLPLSSDYKERYSRLFFNPESMLNQLKNSRIESRYSIKDKTAILFREKLKTEGLKKYIHSINRFISLKEVLIYLGAAELDDVSK